MEVLPQGIQLMANAAFEAGVTMDNTVASMSKMMEEGKLMSADVLPAFAEQLRAAAQANGGLDQALLSNRVAMNRMMTSTQNAADMIFRSGWEEGLTEVFNTLATVIKENDTLFTEFGKTMGKVFKGFAWVIEKVVSPVVGALGSILKGINSAMEKFGDWVALALIPLAKFSPILGGIISRMGGLKLALTPIAALATRIVAPFLLILAVLEEIAEFFDPTENKETLVGFNINDMKDSFKPLIEDLEYIEKLLQSIGILKKESGNGVDALEVPVKTTGFSNFLIKMLTPSFAGLSPNLVPTSSGGTKIENNIEVKTYVGEEVIANSPMIRESINRQIDQSFSYNRN